MQEIIDFIHEHTLENQVYVVAPRTRDGVEFEICFRRDGGRSWRVRRRGAGAWAQVERTGIVQYLRVLGIDMTALENELRCTILTQVIFADMVLRDARKLLGPDVIRRTILDTRDFVGELRQTLQNLTRKRLSLIEGGGEQSESRQGHLSLVPSGQLN